MSLANLLADLNEKNSMSPLSRIRKLIAPIGLTFTFCSCSTRHTPQPTTSPERSHENIQVISSTGWSPTRIAETQRYFIHDSSIISISNDSSQTSPIITTTIYSITTIQSGDSFLLTTKADSLVTNTQTQATRQSGTQGIGQEFHATISNTGRIFPVSRHVSSICTDGIEPVATRIFELTFNYPQKQLKIGDKWNDTVSVTTCRGRTLFDQQSIREYELIDFPDWKNHDTAKIRRKSAMVFNARSNDSKNHSSIHGTGSSTTLLYTERATGVLLESDSKSQTTFMVTTSRGIFPFSQIVSTHIERH